MRISWISGVQGLQALAGLRVGLLPPRKMVDSNPAGLDAWMPGDLEAGGLDPGALEAGGLACGLTGRLGLDWI